MTPARRTCSPQRVLAKQGRNYSCLPVVIIHLCRLDKINTVVSQTQDNVISVIYTATKTLDGCLSLSVVCLWSRLLVVLRLHDIINDCLGEEKSASQTVELQRHGRGQGKARGNTSLILRIAYQYYLESDKLLGIAAL